MSVFKALDLAAWSYPSRTMARTTRSKKPARAVEVRRGAKPRAAKVAKPAPRVRTDKLSVSLGTEDVVWVTRRAKRLGTSVSAVIATALASLRRAEAQDTLLSLLGDDKVSEASVAAARREAFGA